MQHVNVVPVGLTYVCSGADECAEGVDVLGEAEHVPVDQLPPALLLDDVILHITR